MNNIKKIALAKMIIEILIIVLSIVSIAIFIAYAANQINNNAQGDTKPPFPLGIIMVIVLLGLLILSNIGLGITQIVMGSHAGDTLSIVAGISAVLVIFTGFTFVVSLVVDIIILCAKKTMNFDNTRTNANKSIDGNPFNPENPNLGRARVDSPFNTNPNAQPQNSKNPFNQEQNQDSNKK